jgi:serine/threonine protein kinase
VSIAPGVRLGPYEVLASIGAGGMGEVYRARDTALGRDVALKILPEAFARDPDRIARFRREAQLLASLNHPHIGAIYGLEDARGVPVLVLELVEGPTLADRLMRGAIPGDEALAIARQIADALDAAHEQGIVHRDLKPANIKLRPDGTVKVLDFGLAKALESLARPGAGEAGRYGTVSPTLTSPAMTGIGVVLGTAPYMSPEQARGKPVDKSSDIWALGCVLFEMLSGARTFGGDDVTETIAAVVRADPEWSRLPSDTPDSVRRLLRRCLEKDGKRRLADIRDARLDIDDAQHELRVTASTPSASRTSERLVWSAALVLLAGLAAASMLRRGNATALPPEMRVEITTPPTTDVVSIALSPDGEKLVFVASSDGRPRLWLRSMSTGSARPLAGTDGASFPFWSPDSRSIGFFANEMVNRIDIDGGSLRALAGAPVGAGGTWSREGVILYTLVPDSTVSRVSDTGGDGAFLTGSAPGQGQRFPQFLPDGRHFLYYVADTAARGVYVGSLDGPDRTRLFDADAAAAFVPPAEVLFLRAGTLFAQRFDPVKLALEGSAVPLAEGVAVDSFGVAAVSASGVGSIVYRLGSGNRQRQLLWVDRSGKQIGDARAPDPANALNPSLSPDGRVVAVNRTVGGNTDIWLLDLARDAFTRFTFGPRPEIAPVWSADGSRIAFAGSRDRPGFSLYEKPAATSDKESLLLDPPQSAVPTDWSRDGRFLLYRTVDLQAGSDLWALPMDGSGKPIPVAQTTFDERGGHFFPDGQWVAFESNESGRYEIYIQRFPDPSARILISSGGGLQPRFRPDGKELFYVAPDGRLMAVPLRFPSGGQTVEPDPPVALFVTRVASTLSAGSGEEYAVSADGQRFLMNAFVERAEHPITLVLNRQPLRDR